MQTNIAGASGGVNYFEADLILTNHNVRMPFGVFGPWTGFDPNDSRLIVRDTSAQEIYALDWETP